MQHAHHLVIFMREDVAVPDVTALFVEGGLDPGDLIRQGGNHVLGCVLDILQPVRVSTYYAGRHGTHDLEAHAVGIRLPCNGIVLYRRLDDQVGAVT